MYTSPVLVFDHFHSYVLRANLYSTASRAFRELAKTQNCASTFDKHTRRVCLTERDLESITTFPKNTHKHTYQHIPTHPYPFPTHP
jgi:hypothetical protein